MGQSCQWKISTEPAFVPASSGCRIVPDRSVNSAGLACACEATPTLKAKIQPRVAAIFTSAKCNKIRQFSNTKIPRGFGVGAYGSCGSYKSYWSYRPSFQLQSPHSTQY